MTITTETDRPSGPLHALGPLLRGHPAMTEVVGRSNATLAASASIRPFVLAGMAHLSDLRPIVVVTPTLADAERLVDDLGCFMTDGTVALFAPWETLPLERVSPDAHTMGARLEVLWRLFGDEPVPGYP